MTRTREELELREVIAAAKKMQAGVHEAAKEFPPEATDLRDKLVSAADRTVLNLELALEALLKDSVTVN